MSNTEFGNRIIYEDNHLLVVDKLAGELVQGDITGDVDLLSQAKAHIGKKHNKPGQVFMGLPHRLDRPTSGVVVLCRTSKSLTRIAESFRNRVPKKTYHCLVEGIPIPQESDLVNFLLKDGNKNKSYVTNNKKAKRAHLTYRILHAFSRYSLLEIDLHTGRHHQIRAQLAHAGHPIKGDLKYGAKRSNKNGNLCLHAQKITIPHPITKDELTFNSSTNYLDDWGFKI